jgi:membrane associated rhomboid family serine protease
MPHAQAIEGGAPDEYWKVLPSMLGLPVEEDSGPLRRAPWLTWGLAAAISIVSLLALSNLRAAINSWGLVPSQPWRHGGLTFLASFLLHAGILHLVGNVYFLVVFGDNVEDWLGRRRFLVLVVLSALAGDLLHILADPRSTIPCVGASGGISGVIAFYALTFPRARVGLPVMTWVRLGWVWLPAWVMFALWVALQVYGAHQQLAGQSNVSSFAHLGGAAVGLAFWFLDRDG